MQKKRVKIDFKKYADRHEETELVGNDGTKIVVRSHIPYEDKMQLCRDIIENCIMIHDDSICYENVGIEAERIKAIVTYYTNVNTEGAEAGAVVDFVVNNGLRPQIMEYIEEDYNTTEDLYITIHNMVIDTYTDDMSLKKAIRKSFGFLLTGEDITESLAKAEATSGVLFDALNALRDKEKEKEEKIDHGKLSVGGNIINFAKKKE